eukprot:Em0024g26a
MQLEAGTVLSTQGMSSVSNAENLGTFVITAVADSIREPQWDDCRGQQTFRTTVSLPECVIVASIRSEVSIMKGNSFRSKGITRTLPPLKLKLVTASGESLPIVDYVEATVVLGNTEMKHYFVVVKDLITPVILGVDFLQDKGLVLDFTTTPVTVTSRIERSTQNQQKIPLELAPALEAEKQRRSQFCAALSGVDDNSEIIEGCTIPTFDDHANVQLPEFIKPCFNSTVQEFKDLFIMTPGTSNITCCKITTNGPPVKVPPRRIPAYFRTEVESQILHMLQKGIIVESSSLWMAPAVYGLYKRTHKDAYPVPLADEVQDRLSGSVIISNLDLQSGTGKFQYIV